MLIKEKLLGYDYMMLMLIKINIHVGLALSWLDSSKSRKTDILSGCSKCQYDAKYTHYVSVPVWSHFVNGETL